MQLKELNELDVLIENLKESGLAPKVTVVDKSALFPTQNTFASSTTVMALLPLRNGFHQKS